MFDQDQDHEKMQTKLTMDQALRDSNNKIKIMMVKPVKNRLSFQFQKINKLYCDQVNDVIVDFSN
jgi:hypothetical protein